MVLGKKEVPEEYADSGKEAEEGVPEQPAAKEEPKKDEEPVAPGIPGFWLGAMRAHPLISEHVRLLRSRSYLPSSASALLFIVSSSCKYCLKPFQVWLLPSFPLFHDGVSVILMSLKRAGFLPFLSNPEASHPRGQPHTCSGALCSVSALPSRLVLFGPGPVKPKY